MNEQSMTDTFAEATGMSTGLAVAMIILGFVAVLMPFTTGIAVSVLVSWIIVFGGFAHIAYAFAAPGAGSFLWRLLVGVAYVVGGGYLAFHPGLALESLTLVVASILFVESIMEIVVFFQVRGVAGAGWILFDALATLVLAYIIWRPWPASSSWAIGTLVGVNLVISGFTRLMYSAAARKTLKAAV